MNIAELQTLLVKELADIYAAERMSVELLEDIATLADAEDVIETLQYHAEETRQHIKQLDDVFKVLGAKPEETTSIVAKAIKSHYDNLALQEDLSAGSLTMFGLDTVSRLEHFEIASYEGLIRKTMLMGEADCAQLLDDILAHEKQMARAVRELSERQGRQLSEAVTA